MPQGQSSGIKFLDPYLRWWPAELSLITGPYGCGKSSIARLLAYNWADKIGRNIGKRCSIVGWEDQVSVINTEVERYSVGYLDDLELTSVQARRVVDMRQRVGWTQRHPDEQRLISWYVELVEHRATQRRDPCGFFVFDPFNEHDSTRAHNQTETDYVRDLMSKFRRLVEKLRIVLVIVTHVSARSYSDDGSIKPFRAANAAGSVQFGNKTDRAICIMRSTELAEMSGIGAREHAILRFDKNRHEETMGRKGTIACAFDPKTMQLSYDQAPSAEVAKLWS